MYHMIEKIESVSGEITRSYIGYVDDTYDMSNFITNQNDYYSWIETNKSDLENGNITISSYIESNGGVVYINPSETSSVDGLNLNLIADIDNPEGV